MTKDLEKAFAEASRLPAREQDAVAAWILAEPASDRAWEETLAGSRDRLAELGREALGEFRAGRTEPLDTDRP
jgi:hypothetical protein